MENKETKERCRESFLTIPISKEEKKDIREKANEMGLTMSSLARLVLKDFMKKGEL